jgi:hypothetical protein
MNRQQLFEFNEQKWLPQFTTAWMTRILHLAHERTSDGVVWAPKLIQLLNLYGEPKIVDLCSGGGGPVLGVMKILEEKHGLNPFLTLTDLIPNLQTAGELNGHRERCIYITDSIDATDVPDRLVGVRTVFSGFHHLPPDAAFGLLKNAFDQRRHIFIGETTKRTAAAAKKYGKAAKHFFGMTKEIDPTPLQKLFTYIVPVLPMMLAWDNVISCLRTYSYQEIMVWVKQLHAPDYRWEVGELWNPMIDTPYPYIMGYPR